MKNPGWLFGMDDDETVVDDGERLDGTLDVPSRFLVVIISVFGTVYSMGIIIVVNCGGGVYGEIIEVVVITVEGIVGVWEVGYKLWIGIYIALLPIWFLG